jgi:hypothetical protein
MTVYATTDVWRFSRQDGNKLLLMLAIADMANDDYQSFPSVPTLAKRVRCSERQIRTMLAELEADGEIKITRRKLDSKPDMNLSNLYTVLVGEEWSKKQPPRPPRKPKNPTGKNSKSGDANHSSTPLLTIAVPTPATHSTPLLLSESGDPLGDPPDSFDPSFETRDHARESKTLYFDPFFHYTLIEEKADAADQVAQDNPPRSEPPPFAVATAGKRYCKAHKTYHPAKDFDKPGGAGTYADKCAAAWAESRAGQSKPVAPPVTNPPHQRDETPLSFAQVKEVQRDRFSEQSLWIAYRDEVKASSLRLYGISNAQVELPSNLDNAEAILNTLTTAGVTPEELTKWIHRQMTDLAGNDKKANKVYPFMFLKDDPINIKALAKKPVASVEIVPVAVASYDISTPERCIAVAENALADAAKRLEALTKLQRMKTPWGIDDATLTQLAALLPSGESTAAVAA